MSFTLHDSWVCAESDHAILVDSAVLDEAVWVPNSQVNHDSEVYRVGDSGDLVVSSWFADKKGWSE